ncbi:MAG: hypothetical protein GXP06_05585 [Alphaproteobacteria bacterium]|nr:hypothetical protein [Alphaproteobacteria bacterium]
MPFRKLSFVITGTVFAALAALTPASATLVRVTVTNPAAPGGLSLTPLYFGFHNGTVDLFDAGAAASNGIEEIAETGNFAPLRGERLAQQADSVGGVALGTDIGAPGPIEPGESATFVVDLDAADNRFLFFAAMILPSNDTFVGVDDPMQFSLFDAAGNFLGPQTIDITGLFAYDAGTEVNDASVTGGAAFVDGVDISQGAAEGGLISSAMSLSDFLGLTLANGTLFNGDIDFLSDPANFIFARIEISEVPLPPAFLLMAAGLAGLRLSAKRKRSV